MQKVLNLENLLRKMMKTFQRLRSKNTKPAALSRFKRPDAALDFYGITTDSNRQFILFLWFSDRQISQEDKNWEQNIQELQKKVSFNSSPSQAARYGTTSPLIFCFPLDSTE